MVYNITTLKSSSSVLGQSSVQGETAQTRGGSVKYCRDVDDVSWAFSPLPGILSCSFFVPPPSLSPSPCLCCCCPLVVMPSSPLPSHSTLILVLIVPPFIVIQPLSSLESSLLAHLPCEQLLARLGGGCWVMVLLLSLPGLGPGPQHPIVLCFSTLSVVLLCLSSPSLSSCLSPSLWSSGSLLSIL